MVRNGDDFQIDTTAVDVATDRRDARPRIVVHGKANALAEFRAAASRMLPDAAPREIVPIAPIATTATPTPAPESTHHFTTATWISSSFAAATLITSGAIGLTVRSDYDGCQQVACTDSKISSIHNRAIIADVSLLVAVAATASAVWFYVSSSEPPSAAEHVTLLPTHDGAMLGYGGSF